MSVLSSLLTRYGLGSDGRGGALTERRAQRYFTKRGWTVTRTNGHVNLFMQRADMGLLCVTIAQNPVERTTILDVQQQVSEHRARSVIISAHPNTKAMQDRALVSRILLLHWTEVEKLEHLLESMDDRLRVETLTAKVSTRAKMPRSTRSLRIPLTTSQLEQGFFFATDEISTWFVDRGGDVLLVTFAQWGSAPDQPSRWGLDYSEHLGFSVLGFETSTPSWYPEEHMVEAIEVSQHHLAGRFQNRLLFGASQGGFAALKYSKLLGARAALALSPPFSIDPAVATDQRFSSHYMTSLNSGMHIGSDDVSGDLVVCYDPHDISDSVHAANIDRFVAPYRVVVPFGGHGFTYLLADPELIADVLRCCLSGDWGAIKPALVRRRHRNQLRAFNIAFYLTSRKPELACAIFEKHRDGPPGPGWSSLCYRLAEAGQAARVINWMEELASSLPTDSEVSCCLALVALRANRLEIAYNAVAAALAISPTHDKYRYVQDLVVKARSDSQPSS